MRALTTIFAALVGIIITAAMIFGIALIFSLPVMLLWNYCLIGAVTFAREITWLQALGILVLCGFLFKTACSSKSND